jgi:hypothetical protein
MLREMYAKSCREEDIKSVILKEVDLKHIKEIKEDTLEGLAKKELNLSAIVGKSEEAKERRLVPEVIEDFFVKAAPMVGLLVKPLKQGEHIYRPGKTPRMLFSVGEEIEPRFGKLGREYKHIVFNKDLLASDPTIEWVTPGHPLFEAVRIYSLHQAEDDLRRGAIFFDLYSRDPYRLDVYSAAVKDGQGKVVHRRLFVAQTNMDGSITVRQPTIFLDLIPSDSSTDIPEGGHLPERDSIEQALFDKALLPFLEEIQAERTKEIKTIEDHMDISLNELIARQSQNLMDLQMRMQAGDTTQPFAANIKTAEDRLDDLNSRLERRKAELERERYLNISEVQHHGRAWVLPHPERNTPGLAPMVENEEIEKIAVQAAIAYEEARGWKVQSVEQENRGFDLISRKPHPEDPQTSVEVRFIEVKGRSGVGDIALSANEYRTAERLKKDYWLYVVFNCSVNPEIEPVQDPARLGWKPLVKIEHYFAGAKMIQEAAE